MTINLRGGGRQAVAQQVDKNEIFGRKNLGSWRREHGGTILLK
jgi:hypothetical protein